MKKLSFGILLFIGIGILSMPLVTNAQSAPASTAETTDAGAPGAGKGSLGDPTEIFGSILGTLMKIAHWLTGVAGILLNWVVYHTVLQMGAYVAGLGAVDAVWRIMRDLGNIILIFGFLAVGITTLLQVGWYGSGKKMIPQLLLAAVFLNFSLFIAEAVVDVGNMFASEFYTQINGGKLPDDPQLSLEAINREGISNVLMNSLGLQTLYDLRDKLSGSKIMFVGILGTILFLITAAVMLSLAFVLLARFIILILLIIIAPIGFAGLAVPKLENTAKRWWNMLFQQTITAPALLLMLYIALRVITSGYFITGFGGSANPSYAALATADIATPVVIQDFAGILLSFMVAMGLLVACVVLAQKMSAFGGSFATKMFGAMTFGAVAYGMSAPINWAARGSRIGLQRVAPNSGITRAASSILRPLEKARIDARRMPGMSKGLTAVGLGDIAKPMEKSPLQARDEHKKAAETAAEAQNREYDRETRMPRLKSAVASNSPREVSTILSSMSNKDLETPAMRRFLAENPLAASLLPQNRFDALKQSEALSDSEKASIEKARGKDPRFTDKTVAQTISGMTNEQRAQLPGNVLTKDYRTEEEVKTGAPARYKTLDALESSDFAALQRGGKLNSTQKQTVGTYIKDVLAGPASPRKEELELILSNNPNLRVFYGIKNNPAGASGTSAQTTNRSSTTATTGAGQGSSQNRQNDAGAAARARQAAQAGKVNRPINNRQS